MTTHDRTGGPPGCLAFGDDHMPVQEEWIPWS